MIVGGTLRIVLGDQLSPGIAALRDLDPAQDVVLMAEVLVECTYVQHHAKKLVLVLSAMRHFARALRARGVRVDYVTLDDPDNTQSLRGEFLRAIERHQPAHVVATEAGEWRVAEDMRRWQEHVPDGQEVEIRDDTRFFCRIQEFFSWARGRASPRMEFFYREMRRRHGFLMEGDAPAGGQWNFDAENRKALPKTVVLPVVPGFAPDGITREVMALVAARFPDHLGNVEGFSFPVTGKQARQALNDFIAHRLPDFGDWQDAMKSGAPVLFHALISPALNLGLLEPREVCEAAEAAWTQGRVKLNAVEGFIRQILGWREYVRGLYWLHMPEFGRKNVLGATRKLPDFYWTGKTQMNCLRQAVGDTIANAYAHHIQRLMITGNFALMADGGIVGSKPYAASGAYINRMSDYCKSCGYDVKDAVGERACPFNFLYWDFFARHAKALGGNVRVAMPLRTLERMDREKLAKMRKKAVEFLQDMEGGKRIA